jgi:hypothetical protein
MINLKKKKKNKKDTLINIYSSKYKDINRYGRISWLKFI